MVQFGGGIEKLGFLIYIGIWECNGKR